MSMKFAGKVTLPWARLTVTTRSSSGWRIDSKTEWANSGSSSRKRTPRWLRVVSAGRGWGGARPRPAAAADETGVGNRVMRGAERSAADERCVGWEQAGHAVDLGDLQRFV